MLSFCGGLGYSGLLARVPRHKWRPKKLTSPRSGLPLSTTASIIRIRVTAKRKRGGSRKPKTKFGCETKVPHDPLDGLTMRCAAGVGWGGGSCRPHVVEEDGPDPWADVVVADSTGAPEEVGSTSPQSASSSFSTKMLSPIPWSPTLSKTATEQGMVSSKVTSQVSITWLVSRLSTR
jgi:hypothetical protein